MTADVVLVPEGRPHHRVRRLCRQRPLAAAAAGYLALVVLATVAAPLLAPYGADEQDLTAVLAPPSPDHWLGTGVLGRDILSRLLLGGQTTLLGVAISVAVFVVLGVPAGIAAGYLGGWFDWLLSRVWEVLVAVPAIIVLLVVLAVHPNDETLAMIALGVLAAPGLARVVRSSTMDRREALYVRSAQAAGLPPLTIMRRHVMPGIVGPTIVQVSLFAAAAVMLETALGFLGLGVREATWGTLVAEASANLGRQPWLLVPSGLLIISFVLALGLVGDAARDAWSLRASGGAVRHRTPTRIRDTAASASARPVADVADSDPDVLLRVRDLRVAYPDHGEEVVVVDGVSFDIGAGEAVGLVGESGCGKTATASAVLGLIRGEGRIVSGSVRVDGQELVGSEPRILRRYRGGRIGWISQDPMSSLDPRWTVGSQIAEVVSTHSALTRRQARARTLELLELVRLPDPAVVSRAYPHELSGGMAQRVGIAAAIAADPDLLIADEPTTALDVTVQAEILALLRELRTTGTALVLVTHDWGVLAEVCDRAMVMYAGQLVESAPIADLLSAPAHPYTAALVAANPTPAHRGRELPTIPGVVPRPTEWPSGCRFAPRCAHAHAACDTEVPLVAVSGATPSEGRAILAGADDHTHLTDAVVAGRTTRCVLPQALLMPAVPDESTTR